MTLYAVFCLRTEREELVEADYVTITQSGALLMYAPVQAGEPDRVVRAFSATAWVDVRPVDGSAKR